MANVFLNDKPRDIETAIMLEQAYQTDIGNAVAYTDGKRIFINTDDKLFDILPNYNQKMLKWLLWHERYHNELRHHERFFDYLREVEQSHTSFNLNQNEVNIIMDILVHDSLEKLFPELVDTAKENCAQFRNQNSLSYTFTTYTLEDMLQEYSDYKGKSIPPDKSESKDSKSKDDKTEDSDSGSGKSDGKDTEEEKKKSSTGDSDKDSGSKKGHGEGGSTSDADTEKEDDEPEMKESASKPKMEDAHDKTDWSKLEKIDSREFIEDFEADAYIQQIDELKRKKLRLSKLTETLNSLVTTTRKRTYTRPNPIKLSGTSRVILKGTTPGKAALYLCFDASGSMGGELSLFKEIISKAIPQAMETPTEWFSGNYEEIEPNPKGRTERDYFKGKFKDIMPVRASGGYDDDGDRTIELCYKAEQEGYSPIGITDGGGRISWSKKMLVKLRRTILIGDTSSWLKRAKEINPRIEIISLDDGD